MLRNNLEMLVLLEKFESTTRECYACGKRYKLSLSGRVLRGDHDAAKGIFRFCGGLLN